MANSGIWSAQVGRCLS